MKAISQPESQFFNNELGNQTIPTTTERSQTIDGDENTATIEQSSNEPSEQYITLANNAKKWYEWDYLWQCNCTIYSVAVAWKENTEKQKSRQNEGKKTQEYQPKWLRQIERKIKDLREEIPQITEEVRRMRKNGKLTTKMWKKKEMDAMPIESKRDNSKINST